MSAMRFIAGLCLLIAVVALVADATPFVAGAGAFAATSLRDHFLQVAPHTFQAFQTSISGAGAGGVLTMITNYLLSVPTFAVFGVLALIAAYTGRRRSRVKVYAN